MNTTTGEEPQKGRLIMRIPYCDGYYREGDLFFHHDEASGLDTIVHEDEAMAHKPSMYIDDEDINEVLRTRYNQYRDYLDVLEELLEESKVDGNLVAAIKFAETIKAFRVEQSNIMKKLGITF